MTISLIKKPFATEKAGALSKFGSYVFMVARDANKSEIKKAVRALYKVDPVAVCIVNRPAKRKRFGALRGSQPGYKKAIVTLAPGQKIEVQ